MSESNKFSVKQVSRAVPVESPSPQEATIAILGASGDLTARKLLSALYLLWGEGYLTDRAPIIGIARREKSDESFRNEMFEAVSRHARTGPVTPEKWRAFAQRLYYRQADLERPDDFMALRPGIEEIERAEKTEDYPKVAKLCRVIDASTQTVLVDTHLIQRIDSRDRAQFPSWREVMENSVQIWGKRLDAASLPVRPIGQDGEIWAWIGNYDSFVGYMAWVIKSLKARQIGFEPL